MFIYHSLKKSLLIFLMLFIMLFSGCNIQNNNKDFEEWGKTMLNEYSGTEYTKSLEHKKELGIDELVKCIEDLKDYSIEDIKKWELADGINSFIISRKINIFTESSLATMFMSIQDDFINKFGGKQVASGNGSLGINSSYFCEWYVLNDGRKCLMMPSFIDGRLLYDENSKLARVGLAIYIFK